MDESRLDRGLEALSRAPVEAAQASDQISEILRRARVERAAQSTRPRARWRGAGFAAAAVLAALALFVWPSSAPPAVLALPGGIYLHLTEGAQVRSRPSARGLDLELTEGTVSVRFERDHAAPGEAPDELRVVAGATTVVAVGTIFSVSRRREDVAVVVTEGVVQVERSGRPEVELRAGESWTGGARERVTSPPAAHVALARQPSPRAAKPGGPPLAHADTRPVAPAAADADLQEEEAKESDADTRSVAPAAPEAPSTEAPDAPPAETDAKASRPDPASALDPSLRPVRTRGRSKTRPRARPPEPAPTRGGRPESERLTPSDSSRPEVETERDRSDPSPATPGPRTSGEVEPRDAGARDAESPSERTVEPRPPSARSLWQAARSRASEGRLAEALEALEALAALRDAVWSPLGLLEKARLHLASDEPEAAASAARGFLSDWPRHALRAEAEALLCRAAPSAPECAAEPAPR